MATVSSSTSTQTSTVASTGVVKFHRKSSIPSALDSITTSAVSSTTTSLTNTHSITSFPPLPPLPSKRSSLPHSSRVPTPNDDRFTLPTALSVSCSSSMTTTTMSSHDQLLKAPQGSIRRSRSRSMPLNPVRVPGMPQEGLTISPSNRIAPKTFTYHVIDPKENKSEEIIKKQPKDLQTIANMRISIDMEEQSSFPVAESYFKLVYLLQKTDPNDQEIVPILDKIISNPHFTGWVKTDAWMEKAEFYANSPNIQDIAKAFKSWEQAIKEMNKLTNATDTVRVRNYLKIIRHSQGELKKKGKVVDVILKYFEPL